MTGPPRRNSGLTASPDSHVNDSALLFVEIVLAIMLVFTLFLAPVLTALLPTAETFLDALLPTILDALPPTAETVDEVANTVEKSVFSLFILTLGFQVIQGCYPWINSRRRGRTIAQDWRFISKLPDDIAAGIVMAIGCLVGAWVVTLGAATLVGLDDSSDASNTDILVDNQDSPWIIGIILLIVVGAPLVEELLFRGFVLRNLQRWFGGAIAIVVSSFLFAIPHWQVDATWQETVVLLTALGTVGLVLATGAIITNRLGPAVIAHFLFNATGTLIALFA